MPTAPSVRATAVSSDTSSFTPSGTWTDGDLMLVIAGRVVNGGGSSAPSTPAGWTSILTAQDDYDDADVEVGTMYVRVCHAYKSGTGASTFTNADFLLGIALYDMASSNPVDVSSSASNTTVAPGVTTTQDNDIIVGFGASYANAAGIGQPAGMTERGENDLAYAYWGTLEFCSVIQASTGSTGDKTFTMNGLGLSAAQIPGLIAIKGASGATPKLMIVQMIAG